MLLGVALTLQQRVDVGAAAVGAQGGGEAVMNHSVASPLKLSVAGERALTVVRVLGGQAGGSACDAATSQYLKLQRKTKQ